ncbi:MAG: hypothetical protein R3F61_30945 [Myxococcota bacterium]
MTALIWLSLAWAGPVEDGATAWEAGDIEGALEAWKPSADGGWGSGPVKFDVGNAYYRRGDLPRAIAYWRAAGDYRPRTSGVSHNLALARSDLSGVPTPVGAPMLWMRILTPGEVGLLGLLSAMLGSAGLVARRRRKEGLRTPWVGAQLLGIALVALSSWGWWVQTSMPIAVVVDAPAVARATPDIQAEKRLTLQPGAEVAVVKEMRDFLLIETGEGDRGWVPDGAVLRVPR